jgi:hypothetical protein
MGVGWKLARKPQINLLVVLRQKQCLFHTKRNIGGISFFFYHELVGGTVAQRVFLAY